MASNGGHLCLRIPSAYAHTPRCHRTSLTNYIFRDKIIKNFKVVTDHSAKHGSLLRAGPCVTTRWNAHEPGFLGRGEMRDKNN